MSSSSSWQQIPLNHHFLTHSTFENFLCLKECSLLFLFDFFPLQQSQKSLLRPFCWTEEIHNTKTMGCPLFNFSPCLICSKFQQLMIECVFACIFLGSCLAGYIFLFVFVYFCLLVYPCVLAVGLLYVCG